MKSIGICIGAISLVYITGCTPKYYGPNTQNVPLLSHEGEYNISVTGGDQSIDLQTSVSPVNHVGVQLNGSWYLPKTSDAGDKGNGYFVDAGVGYYKAFGPSDMFVFETYGIGGFGGVYNQFTVRDSGSTGGTINSNLARYGVQPVIGFKWKYIDVAISSRFVGLSYFNTEGNLVYGNVNQVNYINDRRHSFLIEPAFTFRAGVDFLKFQLQVQGSFNTLYSDFYQDNRGITIGLIFSPNRYRNIFKKQS